MLVRPSIGLSYTPRQMKPPGFMVLPTTRVTMRNSPGNTACLVFFFYRRENRWTQQTQNKSAWRQPELCSWFSSFFVRGIASTPQEERFIPLCLCLLLCPSFLPSLVCVGTYTSAFRDHCILFSLLSIDRHKLSFPHFECAMRTSSFILALFLIVGHLCKSLLS